MKKETMKKFLNKTRFKELLDKFERKLISAAKLNKIIVQEKLNPYFAGVTSKSEWDKNWKEWQRVRVVLYQYLATYYPRVKK